jgi:hypothetical protein
MTSLTFSIVTGIQRRKAERLGADSVSPLPAELLKHMADPFESKASPGEEVRFHLSSRSARNVMAGAADPSVAIALIPVQNFQRGKQALKSGTTRSQ